MSQVSRRTDVFCRDVLGLNAADEAPCLELLCEQATGRYGALDNVLVVWGHARPDAESVDVYREQVDALIARYPTRAAIVTVVRPGTTPDRLVRETLVELMRTRLPHLNLAFVLQARGLTAAAQRSVLNVARLASGERQRMRTFESTRPALEWLSERLATTGEARLPEPELEAAIARFCR